MAYSYTWSDLIAVGSRYGKGLPLSRVNAQICDFVSQDMYIEYPWKQTIINTAKGMIPLLDKQQDYTVAAPNIMRPLKAWLERTDVTPHENRELNIANDLPVYVYAKSWYAIRAMSLQQAIGLFRLDSAVQVPEGTRLELHVDYQIDPAKVTDLNTVIWFKDSYAVVALEGLLYWIYKLGDDSRAGMAQTDAAGRVTGYSGQLATYKAALFRMKMAEDFAALDTLYPAEPMGLGRDANGLSIFGQ